MIYLLGDIVHWDTVPSVVICLGRAIAGHVAGEIGMRGPERRAGHKRRVRGSRQCATCVSPQLSFVPDAHIPSALSPVRPRRCVLAS